MSILIPVFIQVALTIFLVVRLGFMRVRALKRREAKMVEVSKSKEAWSDAIQRTAHSYNNQAELPVMFYGVVAMILATGLGANSLLVGLAWAFVAFRVAQSFIHTTYNNITHRFYAFLGSIISLAALWIAFAWKAFG